MEDSSKRLSAEDRVAIVESYKNGLSVTKIAELFSTSIITVRRWLGNSGIPAPVNPREVWQKDIGVKFNKVLVLERVENGTNGHVRYKCKCDCGKIFDTWASAVRFGKTRSCGCYRKPVERKGQAPIIKLYNAYRTGALKRNLLFELDFSEFTKLVNGNCTYCGDAPNRKQYAYHRTRKSRGHQTDEFIVVNGIDRKDSTLGYILDNCVSCCKFCNTIKMDMSMEEFNNQILKIHNHLKSNGKL